MFDNRYTKDVSDEEFNVTTSDSNQENMYKTVNTRKKAQKPKNLNDELRDFLTENSLE